MVSRPLPQGLRVVIASPFAGLHRGADLFAEALPDAEQTARHHVDVIQALLRLGEPDCPRRSDRKVGEWTLVIVLDDMDGVAYTRGEAGFSSQHIACSYVEGRAQEFRGDHKAMLAALRHEMSGVMIHELVHSLQHDAKGSAPGWLIEGIADWVRMQAGLGARHWRRGRGGSFENGYDRTAFFLAWMPNSDFVPKLNAALACDAYDEDVWTELAGASPKHLWHHYQTWLAEQECGTAPAPVPTHLANGSYRPSYAS